MQSSICKGFAAQNAQEIVLVIAPSFTEGKSSSAIDLIGFAAPPDFPFASLDLVNLCKTVNPNISVFADLLQEAYGL